MQRGMDKEKYEVHRYRSMHGYCYVFTYSVIRFEGGIKKRKSRGEILV